MWVLRFLLFFLCLTIHLFVYFCFGVAYFIFTVVVCGKLIGVGRVILFYEWTRNTLTTEHGIDV